MARPYSYPQPSLASKIRRSPRQNTLAAWRGIDLTEEERARLNNSKSAGQMIPGVLKGLGLDRKQADLEVLKVWNHLMDPLVVQHAKPVSLAKGTLFVSVD